MLWHSPVGVNIKDEDDSTQDQSQGAEYQHGDLPAHPYSHTQAKQFVINFAKPKSHYLR